MFIRALFVFILVGGAASQDKLIPDTYHKHVRPTSVGGGPVKVGVGLHISSIHHIDLDEMFLVLSLRLSISWLDPRIGSNSTVDNKVDQETLLPVNLEYLQQTWKPDLFFLDTRDIKRFTLIEELAGLWLLGSQNLYFSFFVKVTLDCAMHFSSYPFDVQTCYMTMASFEYNQKELSLYWLSDNVTASHRLYDQLPGYHLTILPPNVTTHSWCQDCFLDPAAAVTASLRLERRYMAYLLNIYIPSGFFVTISWISFLWPPDPIPGRTVLVITSLLTDISMYSSVRHTCPNTDYIKAIDTWFFVCICFNVIVLFEFAAVIWMRRMQNKMSVATVKPFSDQDKSPAIAAGGRRMSQVSLALTKLRWKEEKLESVSRIAFPFLFLLFNLVYWPVYLTRA